MARMLMTLAHKLLSFIKSLHSIVVSTPDFHPGGWGSIPHGSKLVQLFIHFFKKKPNFEGKNLFLPMEEIGKYFNQPLP